MLEILLNECHWLLLSYTPRKKMPITRQPSECGLSKVLPICQQIHYLC